MKMPHARVTTFLALAVAFYISDAPAQTRSWTGALSTDWTASGNWQDGLVPGDGHDVLIPSVATRDPTLPAGVWPATNGNYGSFEVQSGRTVTCLGDASVTNEASGGGASGDGKIHGIGVTIRCASALISGTLSANLQGFPANAGPGTGRNASHGGGVSPYGNLQQPTALGSGSDTQVGGGAIAILADDTITLDGTITANGTSDNNRASAGGSVWLSCDTLAGAATGNILAQGGGNSGRTYAGAGGRISLVYQTRTYAGRVSAVGGANNNWEVLSGGALRGQAGTLWEPGRVFPRAGGTVVIDGSYQYYFPSGSGDYAWDELIVEGAWFELHGDATVSIRSLTMTNNGVFRWEGAEVALGPGDVRLGGPRSAKLLLPTADYLFNRLDLANKGGILAFGDVTAVNASSGGEEANPHGRGVTLNCAEVAIASEGVIDVSLNGFLGMSGGSGPGMAMGAGHGGRGTGTVTYGQLSRPTALGSGGHVPSGPGGGAIAIFADTLDLAAGGTILADGGSNANGCGAGGSVWIRAGVMTGGGTLAARGGNDNDRYGGGGRIAVETGSGSTFDGVLDTRGGLNGTIPAGETGSVFRAVSDVAGVFGVANAPAVSLETDFTVNRQASGIHVGRAIHAWGRRVYEWEDQSQNGQQSADVNNSAVYRLSGLHPGSRASLQIDGGTDIPLTVDAYGVLTTPAVTLEPSATIRVAFPAEGTLILMR